MEKDCFSGVNNLINMDISFNNIETFDSDMFETLKKLKKLFIIPVVLKIVCVQS
jgi:hypothetical protein